MTVEQIVTAILASVGGAGVIIIGLSSYLGKIWANRINESDRAKHSTELERLRAQLTQENQKTLEAERASYSRELEELRAMYSRELETLKGEQALRREYEVFRDQAALQHLQRQIEELYSPLVGLIQYGDVVNQVESAKIPPADRSEKTPKIRRYFVEKYYLPLNAQVSDLIRTKIYLLDSDAIPESFQQFLLHAAQFECLYNMWKDIDEDSANIPGIEYPKTFKQEVRSSLDQLRQTYNEYTKRLNKAI